MRTTIRTIVCLGVLAHGPLTNGPYVAPGLSIPVAAQTPVPFPKPGQPTTPQKPPSTPPVAAPGQPPVATPAPAPASASAPLAAGQPSEDALGVPIYPGAQFITSYNAGSGQRYYLYGTTADFVQIVGYYKTMLKQRGEFVFEEPPVHMFDIGRFREESMAFPPSVTVKDYTWGGSLGYLNPKRGAQPARFKTIIQVVPAPAGTGSAGR